MTYADTSAAAAISRLEAVSFDVTDVPAVARFWAGLLHREIITQPAALLVPGDHAQIGLRFVEASTAQVGRPRLHVHLTSSSSEEQRRTVESALRLGARHLDVGQGADDEFVVLADPGGNELCVIEPRNGFLTATGFLGEVTCDGTRSVGLFWRDALGWSLVWDEGDQTAIQSPLGGTKISWDSWDASPHQSTIGRSRQRFDLLSTDPVAEAERLLCAGATLFVHRPDEIELADPDGNTFSIREG